MSLSESESVKTFVPRETGCLLISISLRMAPNALVFFQRSEVGIARRIVGQAHFSVGAQPVESLVLISEQRFSDREVINSSWVPVQKVIKDQQMLAKSGVVLGIVCKPRGVVVLAPCGLGLSGCR